MGKVNSWECMVTWCAEKKEGGTKQKDTTDLKAETYCMQVGEMPNLFL